MKHTLIITNKIFLAVIIAIFLTNCTQPKEVSTESIAVSQKQVIAGELPDPSIIEVNGVYYACGSSNDWGPIYPIYKSTDLINWTFVNYVFSKPPEWTINSYWAPELFYHNGKFYCYYTARRTDGVSGIGVAVTDDITKGFEDKGQIIEWGSEAIDAFVYNEEGKLYITWKAYGLNPDKPIQLLGSELTEDGLALKGDAFQILTADTENWERGGIEGQCIVKHGDYLYMLYSGNACCGAGCDYQVGVARAKTMMGPWEKFSANPILDSNDSWKCPGHGTAFKAGAKWFYLYHAYPIDGFPYLGRASLLSEMTWDTENGWPKFNIDAEKIDKTVLKADINDQFATGKLENWWHYDIPSYAFNTEFKDDKLKLTDETVTENKPSVAAICVIPEYANFSITTQLAKQTEALKGIVFYATNANNLGFGVKGNELVLWKTKDFQFEELNKITLSNTESIYLKAYASDAHIIDFSYSEDGNNWIPLTNKLDETGKVIGDNLAWWSWGMKTGLFVKSDSVTGDNSAVFNNFKLEYAAD
ncbi:family 43 glycosylhydrolase [Chondrinema litorale]|uniref:family 43 glycosylhydrolase n=1 Tax=Chondrinema litorale TaxID=2994555 RepID=UPI0025432F56|nr:family 43 glycosylhydrolase [Chondrinema litorale]UZR96627.1 family 43 glycosylhydrolase [Chondrinema litorale]